MGATFSDRPSVAGPRHVFSPAVTPPALQRATAVVERVPSIAAQYELAGGAEERPFFIAPNPSNSNVIFRTFTSVLPDLNVSGANRPTIT